jgi:hypothetical protein
VRRLPAGERAERRVQSTDRNAQRPASPRVGVKPAASQHGTGINASSIT